MQKSYLCTMDQLKYPFVWLSRIGHCRGFGIQSPTDYWLARCVINEHWAYYQYDDLGKNDDWLTRKLGRLYFRIANWLQPSVIESDDFQPYLQAGCRKASFGDSTDLIRLTLNGDYRNRLMSIYNKVNDGTVLIVEGIRRDKDFWIDIVNSEKARITFDLYYCGLVLFDSKRHKQNYIVNF